MKTVRNTTRLPVRVPLPGGKTLHLGPGKTGQISHHAVDAPGVQRLLDQKKIALVGEDDQNSAAGGEGAQGSPAATHGHKQSTTVVKRGNR
jgi:hypothetical protein